ncbi:glycosyltransferase family 2 protein [Hyphomicrobium sp. MC8b]|uniref:glycosyltransferase family 2 protein n=1 Tax=Hyphomicrobium sp. MC8b TaxID=300273 RepID=UPI0039194DC0
MGVVGSTAVVIAAKNASATAAYAVSSALRQSLAGEVIFVDDGSRDDTAAVAAFADDGSGRLKILRLEQNVGPSRARNIAIESSTSPFICILDADDYMAPDRLERLFSAGGDDWDFLADDLFFTADYRGESILDRLLPKATKLPLQLSLDAFLAGNISRKDRVRRELGFLKPVIRREFLQTHALRYDERLRLGEDLILYAHALRRNARFKLVAGCGYFAVEHPTSLSGSHRTQDIAELYRALTELDAALGHDGYAPSLERLLVSTRNNRDFRILLDAKREHGLVGALGAISKSLASVPYMAREVAEAKLSAIKRKLSASP